MSTHIDEDLWSGTERFIRDYCDVFHPDGHLVVVYEHQVRFAASLIVAYARQADLRVAAVPAVSRFDDQLGRRIDEATSDDQASMFTIVVLEDQTMSFASEISRAVSRLGKDRCRVVRVLNANEDFFRMAMKPTPAELSLRNATLLHYLRAESEIRITSSAGTDLQVALDPSHRWISNRGVRDIDTPLVLPAGEVATFPGRISGRLVVDGALHINRVVTQRMCVNDSPVTIHIDDGAATCIESPDSELLELASWVFEQPHGRRVGELGFGTNFGVTRFAAYNSHISERAPAVHLGFGSHNQDDESVGYSTDVHLDCIMRESTVDCLSSGRRLEIHDLNVLEGIVHPPSIAGEDANADCCGVERTRQSDDLVSR